MAVEQNKNSGVVKDLGEAYYLNDPKKGESYFIKMETERGERTFWGKKLKQEVQEKNITQGQPIILQKNGVTDVMVKAMTRDEKGAPLGMKEIAAKRNEWEITPISSQQLLEINRNAAVRSQQENMAGQAKTSPKSEITEDKKIESEIKDSTVNPSHLFTVATQTEEQSYDNPYDAGRAFYTTKEDEQPFVLITAENKGTSLMAKTDKLVIEGTDQIVYDKNIQLDSPQTRDFSIGYYDALAEKVNADLAKAKTESIKDYSDINSQTRKDLESLASVDIVRASETWEEHASEHSKTPEFLIDKVSEKTHIDDKTLAHLAEMRKKDTEEYYKKLQPIEDGIESKEKNDSRIQDIIKKIPNVFKQGAYKINDNLQAKQAEKAAEESFKTPAFIQKRYLEVDGKFYDKTKDRMLVFRDKGNSLTSPTDNKEAVQDMVNYAKEKRWTSLKLSGTKEFRREAWLQAESQGIKTQGYTPTKLDMAELQELSNSRSTNKIDALAIEPQQKDTKPKTQEQQFTESHNEAVKGLTQNMNDLRNKDPEFKKKPQDELAKIAYWRSIVMSQVKGQSVPEIKEVMNRFDEQAAKPGFIKEIEDNTQGKIHDRTIDHIDMSIEEQQQENSEEGNSL